MNLPELSVAEMGRGLRAGTFTVEDLARSALARIEAAVPPEATTYALFTGAGSARNQRMYRKAGYRLRGEIEPGVVRMTKRVVRDEKPRPTT